MSSLLAVALSSVIARVGSAQAEESNCGDPFVPTFEIQGASAASPHEGEDLVVEGVVIADFRPWAGGASVLEGMFIQDPDGDGDPLTSDGLFVHVPREFDTEVARGTDRAGYRVRAWGTVREEGGETQLEVREIRLCNFAQIPTPSSVSLPLASDVQLELGTWVGNLEPWEGMLISVVSPLWVVDTGARARHGEVTVTTGAAAWSFTHSNDPSATAFAAYESAVGRRTLVIAEGPGGSSSALSSTGPWAAWGATWAGTDRFVVRAPRQGATGSQASYRLLPVGEPAWAGSPPLDATVAPRHGPRLVTTNLHNLFKDGGSSAACYPSFTSDDCRGETIQAERDRQWDAAAAALARVDADVIAASEIQNDFGARGTTTWQLWLERLNAAATAFGRGCRSYRGALPGVYLGQDAIAVALAYCAERVQLVDSWWPSAEDIARWGTGAFTGAGASRVPLAGLFESIDSGAAWMVVVNHLKSRLPGDLGSCPNPALPHCDAMDGQGAWNAARLHAASALAEWATGLRAQKLDERVPVILAGDFNSYPKEDPLSRLAELGYVRLTGFTSPVEDTAGDGWMATERTVPWFADNLSSRPSYAYNGRLGVIDHLLISEEHVGLVERVGTLSVNVGPVVELEHFSDHDPVFVDLRFDGPSGCLCTGPGVIRGTPGPDVLIGTPGDDVICGFGGDDILLGLGGTDCLNGGLGDDWVFLSTSDDAEVQAEHWTTDAVEGCW